MNGEIIGLSGFLFEAKERRKIYEMLMDKRTRERFTDSSVCFLLLLFPSFSFRLLVLAMIFLVDIYGQKCISTRILNYLIIKKEIEKGELDM